MRKLDESFNLFLPGEDLLELVTGLDWSSGVRYSGAGSSAWAAGVGPTLMEKSLRGAGMN